MTRRKTADRKSAMPQTRPEIRTGTGTPDGNVRRLTSSVKTCMPMRHLPTDLEVQAMVEAVTSKEVSELLLEIERKLVAAEGAEFKSVRAVGDAFSNQKNRVGYANGALDNVAWEKLTEPE